MDAGSPQPREDEGWTQRGKRGAQRGLVQDKPWQAAFPLWPALCSWCFSGPVGQTQQPRGDGQVQGQVCGAGNAPLKNLTRSLHRAWDCAVLCLSATPPMPQNPEATRNMVTWSGDSGSTHEAGGRGEFLHPGPLLVLTCF